MNNPWESDTMIVLDGRSPEGKVRRSLHYDRRDGEIGVSWGKWNHRGVYYIPAQKLRAFCQAVIDHIDSQVSQA